MVQLAKNMDSLVLSTGFFQTKIFFNFVKYSEIFQKFSNFLGSKEPPPVAPGTVRIYSNRFCPFAQRTLLYLHAKQIP